METIRGRPRELPCADDVCPRVDPSAAVAAPAQIDPEVIDACGEDPGNLCEWVYDQTGNQTLAKLSDWLVGTPLTVCASWSAHGSSPIWRAATSVASCTV